LTADANATFGIAAAVVRKDIVIDRILGCVGAIENGREAVRIANY
jgi:hypothetical protein